MRRNEFTRKVAVLGQMSEVPEGLTVEELVENGRHPHRGLLSRLGQADRAIIAQPITQVGLDLLRKSGEVFLR